MNSSSPVGAASGRMPTVTIDAQALAANWRALAARAPRAETGAAVKADGYGLGAATVARTLHAAGCRSFFVAWTEEGIALRQVLPAPGCRIFVLQGLDRSSVQECRAHRLIPVLSSLDDIACWLESAPDGDAGAAVLQLDTGFNRLGLSEAEIDRAGRMIAGRLAPALVMSHLACADEPGRPENGEQLQRFERMAARFAGVPRSLSNSAGVFLGIAYHFDLTRPGIALYGGEAHLGPPGTIRPVATLEASVLQIRTAKRGETVGYGATARLERDSRIAIAGLGYADGYPRSASGSGVPMRRLAEGPHAFLAGRKVPVIGRVSMDVTALDVTDLPPDAVAPGERAEFFGPNISIDAVAQSAGTIPYELLTSLGSRVKRIWT